MLGTRCCGKPGYDAQPRLSSRGRGAPLACLAVAVVLSGVASAGPFSAAAAETGYSDMPQFDPVVMRDGVTDVSFNNHAASSISALRGVGLGEPFCQSDSYRQGVSPRLLFAGMCVDHNTTDKVLLTHNATDAAACASVCESFHGCSFFEYSNASKSCHALPADLGLPLNQTSCSDFVANTTVSTYAAVAPGYHMTFNHLPVVFKCNCHFSGGTVHIRDDTSAIELPASAAGDFAVDLPSRDFSVSLTLSNLNSNVSATSFTNRAKREIGFLTIFHRAHQVEARLFPNGVLEFVYYDAACVTPDPVVIVKGVEGYTQFGDTSNLNPFFPSYDLLFAKNGNKLSIWVNGYIRCESEIPDKIRYAKLKRMIKQRTLESFSDSSDTASPATEPVNYIEGLMGWAHSGEDVVELYAEPGSGFLCKDRNAILTARGLDRSKNDCGARCATTSLCGYFLYKTAEETLSEPNPDHRGASACTLYSACTLSNSTLYEQSNQTVYNGTLFALYNDESRHMPQPLYSVETSDKVCLDIANGIAPASGDLLYGKPCRHHISGKYSVMPSWGAMFHMTEKGFMRSIYDSTLCMTCTGLSAPCYLAACETTGYYTTQLFRYDSVKHVVRYATGEDACLEIPNGSPAAMERCEGTAGTALSIAVNQTIDLYETPQIARTYAWSASSGFLGWVTLGSYTTSNEYIPHSAGLRPTSLTTSTDSTEEIRIRSPVFCTPVHSVSFKLSGDTGSVTTPGIRGYLGILLRDVATGTIVLSKTLSHFYAAQQQISWAESDLSAVGVDAHSKQCFYLEIFDASPSYLILQDVVITTGGAEGDHCTPVQKIRIRKYDPYSTYTPLVADTKRHPLRISEVQLRRASDGAYLTHQDVDFYMTSHVNSSVQPKEILMDGDTSAYVETSSVGVEEFVELQLRRPAVLASMHFTLGCADADPGSCFSRGNNYLVELIGSGGSATGSIYADSGLEGSERRRAADAANPDSVEPEGRVVRQYRVLSERFSDSLGSNATINFCYSGVASNSSWTASSASPHPYSQCLDDVRNPTAACRLESSRQALHSPFFKLDLGVSQAIGKVIFYMDYTTTDLTQIFQVFVGDDNNGPYAAAYKSEASNPASGGYDLTNRLCVNSSFNDYINFEKYRADSVVGNSVKYRFNNDTAASSSLGAGAGTFNKKHIVVDIDCALAGRYVYIVYPLALKMSLYEVEVFTVPTSLRPIPLESQELSVASGQPAAEAERFGYFADNSYNYDEGKRSMLDVSPFEKEPTVYRRMKANQRANDGDWSQIACTAVPVSGLTAWGLPCDKQMRLAFSTTPFPQFDSTMYPDFNSSVFDTNMTKTPGVTPANTLRFILDVLPNAKAKMYADSTAAGDFIKTEREYSQAQACSVHDTWGISRLNDDIFVSRNSVNFTLAAKTSGPLYACVLPHNPGTRIKYQVDVCSEKDVLCSGALDTLRHESMFFGDPFPDADFTEIKLLKPVGGSLGADHHATRTLVSYAQTVDRPSLPNITDWNVCGDDYVFLFDKKDASLGVDSILVEFNTTQATYVKLFFERPEALPWLFHEGWSIVDDDSVGAYSVKINREEAFSMIAVKSFAIGELVQLKGLLLLDPNAVPYLACVSRLRNMRDTATLQDVPISTQMEPILHESFDFNMGDCSAPYVDNSEGLFRTASSIQDTPPLVTGPEVGLHRGKLDSLAGWRARDGGVIGDWYQLRVSASSTITLVRGVVTQGYERPPRETSEWVTTFMVNYSTNGVDFYSVDNFRTFSGNRDWGSHVINEFTDPILARYIRIIPLEWHIAMALRAGLYLCNQPETPETTTGFTKNSTEGCIVESDGMQLMEGNASLRFRAGQSVDHMYGGEAYDREQASYNNPHPGENQCPETYVHAAMPDPFYPARLAVWGRVSNGTLPDSWIFEITGEPREDVAELGVDASRLGHAGHHLTAAFRNGWFNSFYAEGSRGGGITDLEWFCLTVFFKRDGERNIIGLKWYISGTADVLRRDDPRKPEPGWGQGEVVVNWGPNIRKLGLRKKQITVTTWYDHLEVFADSQDPNLGLVAKRLSFDDAKLVDPNRKCTEYVGYNATGDFAAHRLSAQDRPYLLRESCIETCCQLPWCTGVVVPHSRYTNNTSSRGCRLIRRRFFNLTESRYARGTEYYYNDGKQYMFFLKAAVVAMPDVEKRQGHYHDISEIAMRSRGASESAPIFIPGAELNGHLMQTSREHSRAVHSITLLFEGALLDLTEDIVRSMISSTKTASQQASGFEALKTSIIPSPGGVDLTNYPPVVKVHLFSVPGYHITADEILTFSAANVALRSSSNTTLVAGGGTLLGWRENLQAIKIRHTDPCDGTVSCGGRPCRCSTEVCRRAYICGCQHPPVALLDASNGALQYSRFSEGDTAYVINDRDYVEFMQRNNGFWYPGMANYLGAEATVVRLVGGEDAADDSHIQLQFSDGKQYIFAAVSVMKTSGTESCMYHRRPFQWMFDDPYPVVLT